MFEITNDGTIVKYSGMEKVLFIPESINNITVKSIGENVFKNKGIEMLSLPNTLKLIEAGAFDSNNIKELIIPEGVEEIAGNGYEELYSPFSEHFYYVHNGAFSNNQIQKINLPRSLVRIGPHAFSNNLIEEIEINEGTKLLGEVSFYKNKIKMVIIPESILTIGMDAFRSQDRKLNRVIILGDQTRFNTYWETIGFPKKLKPLDFH